MFSPMNTILKEMLSLRKTTTATTTFEHLFLVFVREDVAAAAREREGLCREEEGKMFFVSKHWTVQGHC